MQFMLDTDTCIYLIKRRPLSVLNRFEVLREGSVGMSVVTWGELQYGAMGSENSMKALNVLEKLQVVIPVVSLSSDVANEYGQIRSTLGKRGEIIGNNDLWIAAHALARGLRLVTNNTREFSRVPGLEIENWATQE